MGAVDTVHQARARGQTYLDLAWALADSDAAEAGKALTQLLEKAHTPEARVWTVCGAVEGMVGLRRQQWNWPGQSRD